MAVRGTIISTSRQVRNLSKQRASRQRKLKRHTKHIRAQVANEFVRWWLSCWHFRPRGAWQRGGSVMTPMTSLVPARPHSPSWPHSPTLPNHTAFLTLPEESPSLPVFPQKVSRAGVIAPHGQAGCLGTEMRREEVFPCGQVVSAVVRAEEEGPLPLRMEGKPQGSVSPGKDEERLRELSRTPLFAGPRGKARPTAFAARSWSLAV